MTQSQSQRSFSRRTAFAGLGAGALGVALATRHLSAFAQDASTTFPMAGHPMIGMWQFDIETRMPGTDLAYFDFIKDGTFVASGERGDWVAFGNWRATGERTAELFYVLQGIPAQNVFAADFAPGENILKPGIITIRSSLEIDATGNTVMAEGEGVIYADDGTVENEFDGANARMIGTRMDVVQMPRTLTSTT
jgi:hypothetical protein